MLPSMRWLFLVTPPADGPSNMALDEALMRHVARHGEAIFRVYGWSAPTLSLGRNQRARDCYDLQAARIAGVGFVRRPTGGRALLHHREITYSAAMRAASPADAREDYHFINAVLIAGLRSLGVPAVNATGAAAIPPGPRPCFDIPAQHEIAVGERKLVGSAQWRHDGAVLQHGSILVHDDQHLANALLRAPAASAPSAATLANVLGHEPDVENVSQVLRAALVASSGSRVEDFIPDATVEQDASRLREVYHDDAWTWRR